LTNASINAVIFSCCERGSLDTTSNNFYILPVGPASRLAIILATTDRKNEKLRAGLGEWNRSA